MAKRLIAAGVTLAVFVAMVWFTAWDIPPSQWGAKTRCTVAVIGLFLTVLAASCPYFDQGEGR